MLRNHPPTEADVAQFAILGSSGWIPQNDRMTTALALRFEDSLFVFDAGSGLARLRDEPFRDLIPPVERPIHVFLTHLHLDHTIGLTYLPGLWSNPTFVHVPAEEITGGGPEALDDVFGGPFFPVQFDELLPAITRDAMRPGKWWVAGQRVMARHLEHPAGSLCYRVGDLVALMTDCVHNPEAAEFASGVGVLVHEAWTSGSDDPEGARARKGGHSSAEQAALIAKEADVGELLLVHLPPKSSTYHSDMLERAQTIFPRTSLGTDGLIRSLG